MPILNPSVQRKLLEKTTSKFSDNAYNFYYRYLKIASRHIFRNLSTVETSIKFQKDLKECIPLINRKFNCEINRMDINNPSITDFYRYLYNRISTYFNSNNTKSDKVEGSYFKQIVNNNEFFFFRPNIFYSLHHSWFLSDTPIAILTIQSISSSIKNDYYQLIKLEIDLMKAAGFTLVLCAIYNINSKFIFDLIQTNQFSEIHLNCNNDDDMKIFLTNSNMLTNAFSNSFKGFMYIYSPYIRKHDIKYRKIYKELKKIPRLNFLTFSENLNNSIKETDFFETMPFSYCKSGFKYKYLKVELSNVPIYDYENDNLTFVPSQSSEISICYISPDNFLNWSKDRVKVLFDDTEKNQCYEKFVNFEDLHEVKKNFYTKDPLSAGKINDKKLQHVNELGEKIERKIEKRRNKKFKKDFTWSISKEKQINKLIKYVTYAYTYCEESLENDFSIHKPQIYAVIEACNKFLIKDEYQENIDKLLISKNFIEYNIDKKIKGLTTSIFKEVREFQKSSTSFLINVSMLFYLSLEGNKKEKLINFYEAYPEIFYRDFYDRITKPVENLEKIDLESLDSLYKAKIIIENNIKYCKKKSKKGFVFQVDTGEGKSCIISLLAAILALKGKTVHISSSNIKLANRDYMDSFDFFKQLNLKSAVFVHENELPITPRTKNSKNNNSKDTKNDNKNDSDIINNVKSTSTNDLNDEIVDSLFKENINNYFNTNTQDDKTEYSKYYYDIDFDYYDKEQFQNSSKMNFSVCGLDNDNNILKNKPNIIFSTFVNFECFYLKMMENLPGNIDDYYDNCALLVDEADSILIDEITNGTVISREIKSNAKEVLQFVYDQRIRNISAEETFDQIKSKWPKCSDLTLQDVEKMYKEVDLVNSKEFTNGKKYSIEEFEVRNKKRKDSLKNDVLNLAKDIGIKVAKGLIKEFSSNKDKDENNKEEEEDDDDDDDDNDDDDDDDDDDEEEEEENDEPVTVFRHIVPFDYDHKGILEPNKEFSGFVQQFIAIKESKEHQNMIIKDISMNYLYISHPIFVNLYSKVCGFTGTIGTKKEKQIYAQQYNLGVMKIPRHKVNLSIEFPMILCDSIKERNKNIVFEILQFHKNGNPVLVIFDDMKEINDVVELILKQGIRNINVFDGKDDIIRPDKIAGLKGAISLGTNVCGRGTNIIIQDKPLHVIITYYSSNTRVMNQARGRTARQGQKGTTRVICLKQQFLYFKVFDDDGMSNIIDEFTIKNEAQKYFIMVFQKAKPWIFSNDIKEQELGPNIISRMKEIKINVNRIVAYKYEFPLKMSVKTFLDIQSQKILSILNCPNSVYTWKLFQKYVREMIFQSWSLMVNSVDEAFFSMKENEDYKKEIDELNDSHLDTKSKEYLQKRKEINEKFSKNIKEYKEELDKNKLNLIDDILNYLPNEKNDIVSNFLNIIDIVVEKYETKILDSFNSKSKFYLQSKKKRFLTFQIGFRPFALLTESGARVNYKNLAKTNYIKDPELIYMKKKPNNRFCLLSITEKIDDLFNKIFQSLNEFLGNKTFLKFFMRRTLFGCEFGVCMNFPCKNDGVDDPNCIIDKDPLLLFTINVKSVLPILAGILIVVLVYAAVLTANIAKNVFTAPVSGAKKIIMKAVGITINIVAPELVGFVLDKIIDFLNKILKNQIKKLESYADSEQAQTTAEIIKLIKKIFNSKVGKKINKKFSKFLGNKIKVKLNWNKLLSECIDPERIMKISFLVLLCLASFIMNFNLHKKSIKRAEKNAEKYDKSFKADFSEEGKNQKKIDATINSLQKEENKQLKKDGQLQFEEDYYIYSDDDNEEEENDSEEEEEEKEIKLTKKQKKERKEEMKKELEKVNESIIKEYLYKFNSIKPSEKIKKFSDFIEKNDSKSEIIFNGVAFIKSVIQKGLKRKEYLRLYYENCNKEAFIQQVRLYETNQFPSILKLVGYSIHKKKRYLYVETKQNGTLSNYISKNYTNINETNKIIIAYGIATALEFLHNNKVIHRNLNPLNVFLDSSLFPYLSEFQYAKQIQTKYEYMLNFSTPGFMPPEFIADYKSNQDSFYFDVFSYGMTIFILVTGINPFLDVNEDEILTRIKDGWRPDFPQCIDKSWIDLIQLCWNQNPNERPTFTKICDIIESNEFLKDSINNKEFNDYKNIINRKTNEE